MSFICLYICVRLEECLFGFNRLLLNTSTLFGKNTKTKVCLRLHEMELEAIHSTWVSSSPFLMYSLFCILFLFGFVFQTSQVAYSLLLFYSFLLPIIRSASAQTTVDTAWATAGLYYSRKIVIIPTCVVGIFWKSLNCTFPVDNFFCCKQGSYLLLL